MRNLIEQATSLFDLLPCRTTELKIAGDWLEDQGLHSFMANVVRNGRWSSASGIAVLLKVNENLTFFGNGNGTGFGDGTCYGAGHGIGHGDGNGSGIGYSLGYYRNVHGYGNGKGHGYGNGCGYGDGRGYGYESESAK